MLESDGEEEMGGVADKTARANSGKVQFQEPLADG